MKLSQIEKDVIIFLKNNKMGNNDVSSDDIIYKDVGEILEKKFELTADQKYKLISLLENKLIIITYFDSNYFHLSSLGELIYDHINL